ncbi:MAG: hypothetical protein WBA57_14205 [Elainellaceae cyanobacterium]
MKYYIAAALAGMMTAVGSAASAIPVPESMPTIHRTGDVYETRTDTGFSRYTVTYASFNGSEYREISNVYDVTHDMTSEECMAWILELERRNTITVYRSSHDRSSGRCEVWAEKEIEWVSPNRPQPQYQSPGSQLVSLGSAGDDFQMNCSMTPGRIIGDVAYNCTLTHNRTSQQGNMTILRMNNGDSHMHGNISDITELGCYQFVNEMDTSSRIYNNFNVSYGEGDCYFDAYGY